MVSSRLSPGRRSLAARGARTEGLRVVMAAVCEICGKRPGFGMRVSHSHRRTKRRWNPNVQRVRALVEGTPRHLYACTSCIRAGKVERPRRRPAEVRAGA